MGVPKLHRLGLLQLWGPITLRVDLGSWCGLKKSCNPHRELSNGMSHALYSQINWIDSQLFLVEHQISSLTPDHSFGHNFCFKCPNEQCEPILDIYVPRAFQWYKKRYKPLSFDPWNCSLKFWKSTGTPFPKVGVALGVWRFTPSYSLTLFTLSGACDVTPELALALTPGLPLALTLGLSLGPQPCNPFALVARPKLGLWH
jgi:hypothetical protein